MKLRWRPVLSLALLLLALVTFPAGWGSWSAERIVARLPLLRELAPLRLRIHHLSLRRLSCSLEGGDAGAPQLQRCEVYYTPWGLCRRRIAALQVTGLTATLLVESNRVALAGLPTLELPQPGGSSGAVWQVGEALVSGIRIELRVVEGDAAELLTGMLRLEAEDGTAYRLNWQGHLLAAAAALEGRLGLEPFGGTATLSLPRLSQHHLLWLLQRLQPDVKLPLIDGVVALEAAVTVDDSTGVEARIALESDGVLTLLQDGVGVVCDHLALGAGWRGSVESGGEVEHLALSLELAQLVGVVPEVAQLATNATLEVRAEQTISLPPAPGSRWHLAGQVSLPGIRSWYGGVVPQVRCDLKATAEAGELLLTLPPLHGVVPVAGEKLGWSSGRLGLKVEFDGSRLPEQEERIWSCSGLVQAAGARLQQRQVSIEEANLALPFEFSFSATNQLPYFAPLVPQLAWQRARLMGHELTITPFTQAEECEQQSNIGMASVAGLFTLSGGWEVAAPGLAGGRVMVDGAFDMRQQPPLWLAMATLEEGMLTLKQPIEFQIEGVAGKFSANGEPRLQPGEATFRSAVLAGFKFDGGKVRWRLDSNELLIERGEVDWCGGKLRLYAVRVNLEQPDVDLILYAEQLDAGALLALVKPLQGTATGRLYGRIPLRIRGDRVVLSEGFLYALPGETGRLQLSDTSFLRDYIARTGLPKEVQRDIIATLADLNYNVLRFDLDSMQAREARLVIKVAGEPAGNKRLPPVDLDIRINGPLEALLNFGIHMNKGVH